MYHANRFTYQLITLTKYVLFSVPVTDYSACPMSTVAYCSLFYDFFVEWNYIRCITYHQLNQQAFMWNSRPADIVQPYILITGEHFFKILCRSLDCERLNTEIEAVRMVKAAIKNLSLPLHVARLQSYRVINFTISTISNWLNHIATCNASILCHALFPPSFALQPIVWLMC